MEVSIVSKAGKMRELMVIFGPRSIAGGYIINIFSWGWEWRRIWFQRRKTIPWNGVKNDQFSPGPVWNVWQGLMTCQVFLLYKHLFCNLHHLSLTFCLLPSQKHVPFRTTWGSQDRFLLVNNSKNCWTGGYIRDTLGYPNIHTVFSASSWGQETGQPRLSGWWV